MRIERISPWLRFHGPNLEIGNFGNDGVIPKSISCRKVNELIEGDIILKDEVKGNLILNNLRAENNVDIVNKVEGSITAHNCRFGGQIYLYKDSLGENFEARNSVIKGIFFFKGKGAFPLIDLSASRFEYLFFNNSVRELRLQHGSATVVKFNEDFLACSEEIKADSFSCKEIRTPSGYKGEIPSELKSCKLNLDS